MPGEGVKKCDYSNVTMPNSSARAKSFSKSVLDERFFLVRLFKNYVNRFLAGLKVKDKTNF